MDFPATHDIEKNATLENENPFPVRGTGPLISSENALPAKDFEFSAKKEGPPGSLAFSGLQLYVREVLDKSPHCNYQTLIIIQITLSCIM